MSKHPIAARRAARNWTQADLEAASGVNLRTIKRAEAGEALRADTLASLCAALECGPAALRTPARLTATTERWTLIDHLGSISAGCATGSAFALLGLSSTMTPSTLEPWGVPAAAGLLAASLLPFMALLLVLMEQAPASTGPSRWDVDIRLPEALRASLIGSGAGVPATLLGLAWRAGSAGHAATAILFMPTVAVAVIAAVVGSTAPKVQRTAILVAARPHLAAFFLAVAAAATLACEPVALIASTAALVAVSGTTTRPTRAPLHSLAILCSIQSPLLTLAAHGLSSAAPDGLTVRSAALCLMIAAVVSEVRRSPEKTALAA